LFRTAIVLILVGSVPAALMGLAASGATLSNPDASVRVGTIFGLYILTAILRLGMLIFVHSRAWAWLLAATVALLPFVVTLTAGRS